LLNYIIQQEKLNWLSDVSAFHRSEIETKTFKAKYKLSAVTCSLGIIRRSPKGQSVWYPWSRGIVSDGFGERKGPRVTLAWRGLPPFSLLACLPPREHCPTTLPAAEAALPCGVCIVHNDVTFGGAEKEKRLSKVV